MCFGDRVAALKPIYLRVLFTYNPLCSAWIILLVFAATKAQPAVARPRENHHRVGL
jgi:hypothetical protein